MPEDKPSVVGLLEGAVYFFSRKPRVLEVDTPFFDAAVEGTEFLVRVEPQRARWTAACRRRASCDLASASAAAHWRRSPISPSEKTRGA